MRHLNDVYSEVFLDSAISLILSLDTMTTLGVYFVPKILAAIKDTLPKPNIELVVSHGILREKLINKCYHNE